MQRINLVDRILSEIGTYDGPAVTDNGTEYSYQRLFSDVFRMEEQLKKLGVGHSFRCGLLADDSYGYIVSSLAVLHLESAIIPLSTRASEAELAVMPGQVGLNGVIEEARYTDSPDAELEYGLVFRNLKPEKEEVPLPEGRIPAFIRFSSGTTGTSKGVVLSHQAVIERTDACTGLGVTRGERVLWVLDMAFHFVVTIILFLRKGAHIVLCGQPVEQKMPALLASESFSLLYATPYHYRVLTSSAACPPEALARVRLAVSTAMKLQSPAAEAFRTKFRMPLSQAYGIIEVGLPCINSEKGTTKTGSAGKIQSAYDVRIFEPDAEGVGRIGIRGPGMFDAYLSPFRLRSELCPDGYFFTGDMGRIDGDGFLFILGRSKNVIIFAGMKIFPYEVEDALLAHPAVKEVLVSGIPGGDFGELPAASVVLAEDAVPGPELEQSLRKFAYGKLAPYKVPKVFRFVPSLPKTASGKIRRETLNCTAVMPGN